MEYKEGQAGGAVGAIITLIVGIGVSVLVLIFVKFINAVFIVGINSKWKSRRANMGTC